MFKQALQEIFSGPVRLIKNKPGYPGCFVQADIQIGPHYVAIQEANQMFRLEHRCFNTFKHYKYDSLGWYQLKARLNYIYHVISTDMAERIRDQILNKQVFGRINPKKQPEDLADEEDEEYLYHLLTGYRYLRNQFVTESNLSFNLRSTKPTTLEDTSLWAGPKGWTTRLDNSGLLERTKRVQHYTIYIKPNPNPHPHKKDSWFAGYTLPDYISCIATYSEEEQDQIATDIEHKFLIDIARVVSGNGSWPYTPLMEKQSP